MTSVSTDEIYEKYLKKAIAEINDLGHEIAAAGNGERVPVLGSGHPRADVMLLKHRPQAAEVQEGVAFFGRTGQAILKSLQRLNVDPLSVYGTNCLKFADEPADEARPFLVRELHIVQPKLVVVMGEDALGFLNALEFPLAADLEPELGVAPGLDADGAGALRAGHRRVARRAAGEDGVLERLQGLVLVGRVPPYERAELPPYYSSRSTSASTTPWRSRCRASASGGTSRSSRCSSSRRCSRSSTSRCRCGPHAGCSRPGSASPCWPRCSQIVGLDVLANFAKLAAVTLLAWWFLASSRRRRGS